MQIENVLLPGFCIALGLGLWCLQEAGRRVGQWWKRDPNESGTGAIDGSILALLGLLLAFQMSRAGGRLDDRRDVILQEANAIGTAYLRLDLLPANMAGPLRELFRTYADSRIRFQEAMPDVQAALAADAASSKLQTDIWAQSMAACREANPQAAMLLVPALNQMFDLTTTSRIWAQTHASLAMIGFIFFVALMSAFVGGYGMSANLTRPTLHMLAFAVVTAVAICLILDLEFPRLGFIRIGVADEALAAARRSMD